jgi:hypothetical protein
MTRAVLRVTHQPAALVCSAQGIIALIVVGRDLPFYGGLRVAHAASALLASPALGALQPALIQPAVG